MKKKSSKKSNNKVRRVADMTEHDARGIIENVKNKKEDNLCLDFRNLRVSCWKGTFQLIEASYYVRLTGKNGDTWYVNREDSIDASLYIGSSNGNDYAFLIVDGTDSGYILPIEELNICAIAEGADGRDNPEVNPQVAIFYNSPHAENKGLILLFSGGYELAFMSKAFDNIKGRKLSDYVSELLEQHETVSA